VSSCAGFKNAAGHRCFEERYTLLQATVRPRLTRRSGGYVPHVNHQLAGVVPFLQQAVFAIEHRFSRLHHPKPIFDVIGKLSPALGRTGSGQLRQSWQ